MSHLGQREKTHNMSRTHAYCLTLALVSVLAGGCSKQSLHSNRQIKTVTPSHVIRTLWQRALPNDKQEAQREIDLLNAHIQRNAMRQKTIKAVMRDPQTRATQHKRICQATKGICKSAKRICLISKKYPLEAAFLKACLRANKDCAAAQNTCRTANP